MAAPSEPALSGLAERRRFAADWSFQARLLLVLSLAWLIFGLLLLFSASVPVGVREEGNGFYFILRQSLAAALGVGVLWWVCRTRLERLIALALPAFLVLVVAVWLVRYVPALGAEINGAHRWLKLGPLMLQPSELIKPCLVLFAAPLFARWKQLSNRQRLAGVGAAGLAVVGVLQQPDLGTAVLLGAGLWLMALLGGLPLGGLLGVLALGGIGGFLKISSTAYQMDRINAFLDPWQSSQAEGYQLVQSLIAVGSGGIDGAGFGLSAQKISLLPYPYSDFIFAVFCEEFGLVGSVSFLLFLFVFLAAGLSVALRAVDPMRRLVAAGSTLLLVIQSLLHIAVVTGSVPPKGIPLPLVSYGGSGLLASLVLCGLLIRAAREVQIGPARLARRKIAPPEPVAAPVERRVARLPDYLMRASGDGR